jgi:hypothetical protein
LSGPLISQFTGWQFSSLMWAAAKLGLQVRRAPQHATACLFTAQHSTARHDTQYSTPAGAQLCHIRTQASVARSVCRGRTDVH